MRRENRPLHLTKRDMDVMRWINGFGFVTIDLIAAYWRRSLPTVYGRVKKLMAAGYLIHQRVFHGQAGIYRVYSDPHDSDQYDRESVAKEVRRNYP